MDYAIKRAASKQAPRDQRPPSGSPVGGPHSLGEIRGAAAVGKASAAARNFLRVPSAPRAPMAMALTQAPRTGALVPMGVGVARLFLKKF